MLDKDISELQIPDVGYLQLPGPAHFPTPSLTYTDQMPAYWAWVNIAAGNLYDECDLGQSKLGWAIMGK